MLGVFSVGRIINPVTHFRQTYPLELSKLEVEHRPVNLPAEGHAAAASGVPALCRSCRSGCRLDDHGVSQPFQLGDQPTGVGFVVAAFMPVRAEVGVGLVTLQHVVGRNQDRVRDRDLGPAHPTSPSKPGVLDGQIGFCCASGQPILQPRSASRSAICCRAAYRPGSACRRTRSSLAPGRSRRPDGRRSGTGTCPRRSPRR
jgi:hypothetical protein